MVKQELLFVGQESGKLIAIRDIIHKVVKGLILSYKELLCGGLNIAVGQGCYFSSGLCPGGCLWGRD